MYGLLASVLLLFTTSVHGITKYACQDTTMEILCPFGLVIDIKKVNYGRKSKDICQNINDRDTDCSAANAYDLVVDRCEGEQSCLIVAGTCNFGDPCYGTYKYLEVEYQCVPDPCGYQYGFHCSGGNLVLTCTAGQTLRIARANYGRETYSICSGPGLPVISPYCLYKNATEIVRDMCAYKETCTIPAGPPVFGDPCYGTFKYLWVKYKCVTGNECDECDKCNKCDKCNASSSESDEIDCLCCREHRCDKKYKHCSDSSESSKDCSDSS